MVHSWTKDSDGTGSTVRVVVFDHRKAFDLIDHTILAGKLMDFGYPTWFFVLDHRFSLRPQTKNQARGRLQVGMGGYPGRGPQGTKLGPWLFILIFDDINTSDTEIWKCVDDTTIAAPVAKNQASTIQDSVNYLIAKSDENKFQLNEGKCKEMRISFAEN